MVKLYDKSADNILGVVKRIKSETSLNSGCDAMNIFLPPVNMLSQVKAVEQKLKMEFSEQMIESMTHEELQSAAEMFIYLNICPEPMMPWFRFFKDLFQTQSADQMILTLNRMIKIHLLRPQEINNNYKLVQRISKLLFHKLEETYLPAKKDFRKRSLRSITNGAVPI